MNNKEKYKLAFSCVRPSSDFLEEISEMKIQGKQTHGKKFAAAAIACVLVAGSAATAYAANLGGIQRTVQLWLHGDQTQVTIEFDGNGAYDMEYTDENGALQQQGGGGVAFDIFGNERPLTEEELLDELMSPQFYQDEDGRSIIAWGEQVLDITDEFVDGVCYVKLVNGDETRYITAIEGQGYSMSPNKFLAP